MEKIIFFIAGIVLVLVLPKDIYSQDSTKVEWEMQKYFFVFLNRTPEPPKMDSAKVMELQMAHLANIEKLFNEGKCRLAGPFLDKGDMRGILILDVKTVDEAKKLMDEDPFVVNGFLQAEIKPWYGPAGLKVTPQK